MEDVANHPGWNPEVEGSFRDGIKNAMLVPMANSGADCFLLLLVATLNDLDRGVGTACGVLVFVNKFSEDENEQVLVYLITQALVPWCL